MYLGYIEFEYANYNKAESYFTVALNMAQKLMDLKSQAIQHNNLGRLYKKTGKLSDAKFHFEQAIKLAQRVNDYRQVASTRNNLSDVYRQSGEITEADAMNRAAIAEHRKLGQEGNLAHDYLTKANIEIDKGLFQQSEKSATHALNIFIKNQEVLGQIQAYASLARFFRYFGDFDKSITHIKRAIYLSKNKIDLAGLYYQLGRVNRYKIINFEQSETLEQPWVNKDALDSILYSISLYEEVGDYRGAANAKLELVTIMLLKEESLNNAEVVNILDNVWEKAVAINDDILKGYVSGNRGIIAYKAKDFRKAGFEIGKSACYMAQYSGKAVERYFGRLYDALLNPNLQDNESNDIAEGVLGVLKKHGNVENSETLRGLKLLCEQMLQSPNI
jgi:tetratricopeptide (TPR) repeat protein